MILHFNWLSSFQPAPSPRCRFFLMATLSLNWFRNESSRHHAPLAQLDRRDRPEVQFLYGAPVIY